MTVYVDDAFIPARVGRITARWCHMAADTREELDAMAARIGLSMAWIQYPGTWKEHYDLTESRRAAAIAAGAVVTSRRELVAWMTERNTPEGPTP